MANRFTPKAQEALSGAKKCAEKMGHSYIGTEHLLLGMLSCECICKRVLEEKRIFYSDVYEKLSEIAGVGEQEGQLVRELTPKCKKIIESSAFYAKRFNSRLIGTEHFLYAICEEPECVGGRILITLGSSPQSIKGELTTLMDTVSGGKADASAIPNAPVISTYGKSLNALALQGKCDPVIGRDKELSRLIQILSRRTKNNPCLIGEPGVGKTALVEGLAQRINEGSVPKDLKDKTIVSLDLSSMIAGAKYRGEFEERMRNVLNEARSNRSIILFIDEIHTIVGAGAAEGAVDAANIIKPALARGQIQIIGATTFEEYRRHIEKDGALERRFQPITIKEPSESEATEIILGLKERYESFHGVEIPSGLVQHAVKLSERYIPDRFLPDKAIDIIDEACSLVKMSHFTSAGKIADLETRLEMQEKERDNAIFQSCFDLASEAESKAQLIRVQIEKEVQNQEKSDTPPLKITKNDIEAVVTQWTSIPVSDFEKREKEYLSNLDGELSKRIIGQDEAVKKIAASIKRGRAGLKSHKRPIGSFLLLGPTGVGKTELAKVIADTVFGDKSNLVRLDMSEYMERHTVSKLIGSPAGYVGYEDGGVLTKAIRQKPYSVVLFDEIEKAHPDIYNLLLQILDEGVLTDSCGRAVSFKNTILILTSNIGAKQIEKSNTVGFSQESKNERIKSIFDDSLKKEFSPEFLNRLDEIITFNPLTQNDAEKIVGIMLKDVQKMSLEIGIELEFDESISSYIAKKGYSREYGARPLRRSITTIIEEPLSDKIISGEINFGDTVSVILENDALLFKCLSAVL